MVVTMCTTEIANKPLHVSKAAVANFSIPLSHNGLRAIRGWLPVVRQRLRHVNGDISCDMTSHSCVL